MAGKGWAVAGSDWKMRMVTPPLEKVCMGLRCGCGLRDMIADVTNEAEKSAVQGMLERLRAGDVRALARAVSMVEDGRPEAAELLRLCRGLERKALRIGVTGPPGAGKSTLVDGMARWLRGQGGTVGVLAVDPSSPYTGGALLGDRIRMQGFAGDEGVYIRSMASRGAMGGIAQAAEEVCAVMEAAGRGTVLIETVGVGQDEVDVVRIADVTVLVLVPGMGDEVQSLKAGVMEVADIFVVNKSDKEGAELVEAEIRRDAGAGGARGGVGAAGGDDGGDDGGGGGGVDGGGAAVCGVEAGAQGAAADWVARSAGFAGGSFGGGGAVDCRGSEVL